MKQYNKFIFLNLIIFLIIVFCANIIIVQVNNSRAANEYVVEINRIMNEIEINGFNENNMPSTTDYKYIKQITYLGIDENSEKAKVFFEGYGLKPSQEFAIRILSKNNNINGYLRFTYIEKATNLDNFKIIYFNTFFAVIFILFFSVMFYIKFTILKPFYEINELPFKLSKGHLSGNLKESKNRYFGKFLWGLDLLRESLEQHKKRELELEKEKKLMILSISHDIKTPLNAIKLYSKAFYEKLYDSEEKQLLNAKNIEEKVTQIESFIGEIVKMSTTDIFDFQVKNTDFYLKELVNKIKESYSEKLKLIKTDFIIKPFADKLINGDIDKLIEVVENVMENAIKYGDGRLIEISFSNEDFSQLIIITNSGVSVSDTESIHVFDSFWRGSNSQNKKGNGLGLYICKQIMHKMDGEIFMNKYEREISFSIVIRES